MHLIGYFLCNLKCFLKPFSFLKTSKQSRQHLTVHVFTVLGRPLFGSIQYWNSPIFPSLNRMTIFMSEPSTMGIRSEIGDFNLIFTLTLYKNPFSFITYIYKGNFDTHCLNRCYEGAGLNRYCWIHIHRNVEHWDLENYIIDIDYWCIVFHLSNGLHQGVGSTAKEQTIETSVDTKEDLSVPLV